MPETIHCPQCARELRVPESLLGKKVKCPGCGTTFTAPAATPGLPGEGFEPAPEPAPGGTTAGTPEAPPPPPPPTGTRPREIDLIANFALFGGIWACLLPFLCCLGNVLTWVLRGEFNLGVVCCLVPEIYSIVIGILSIMTGLKLRRPDAYTQPPPTVNAILRIVNILMLDIPNAVLGGLTLYWLKTNPTVQAYYQGGAATSAPPG